LTQAPRRAFDVWTAQRARTRNRLGRRAGIATHPGAGNLGTQRISLHLKANLNSMAISTKPPSGTRDFLPDDIARRTHVVDIIRGTYEAHGFVPLETPTMERLDVLTGKYGAEGDQLMFRVLKRRDNLPPLDATTDVSTLTDLGLRYDLTVPLARVVAAHAGRLPRFFKRYQIQPVWRADRPQRGRFREFYQCDVDYLGTTSSLAEASVIGAITDALGALGFGDVRVRLNDRRILRGMMETASIPEESRSAVLTIIDKIDKILVDGVTSELRDAGLSETQISQLAPALLSSDEIVDLSIDASRQRIIHLRAHFEGHSDCGLAGCDALSDLLDLIEAAPPSSGAVVVDPSLARGLSYYTGPIFEVAVDDLPGSIGGGGRYDKLIGMFRNQDIPAVGFSLGLERILVVMEERGMFPPLSTHDDIMFLPIDATGQAHALRAAQIARSVGARTSIYPDLAKLGKQIQYAESLNVPLVGICGEREAREGCVGIKRLSDGTQATIPLDSLADHLVGMLEK